MGLPLWRYRITERDTNQGAYGRRESNAGQPILAIERRADVVKKGAAEEITPTIY
jgi:hypothetical protein